MLEPWLGLHRSVSELTFANMAARTVIVFAVGLATLRLGARRGLGRNSAFDVLLFVVWGSVVSRGINGQAPFFPTLGTSVLLVALHWIVSFLASRFHCVSRWAKGTARVLVREGKVDTSAMRWTFISHDDLEENLRLYGNVATPGEVREARLERNGQISVIRKESK